MYREREPAVWSQRSRSRSPSPKGSERKEKEQKQSERVSVSDVVANSSNSNSNSNGNGNASEQTENLTEEQKKELKKKERLARIQQWKAQKAAEARKSGTPEAPVASNASHNGLPKGSPHEGSNERSNGSYGLPKEGTPGLPSEGSPGLPNGGSKDSSERPGSWVPKTFSARSKTSHVKSLFMADENDGDGEGSTAFMAKRPLKKLPSEQHAIRSNDPPESHKDQDQDQDADSLDAFMSELNKQDSGTAYELPAAVMNQDEDSDTADAAADGAEQSLNPQEYMALMKQKEKKDIPPVDHSKMDYLPFRKNFYIEPQEIGDLSEQQVEQLRLELDGIKVRGLKCPKPIMKWSQLGLQSSVMNIVTNTLNYSKPSSIQAQGIPAIMSGRDIIGVAKTGSGKTMAFLLPMFRHIKDQPALSSLDGPIALVMTPTRELALQIYRDCKPFIKALDLRAVCAYGGAPIKDQIAELKRGAEIVVCTPGRMIDLLTANQGRVTNLSRVTYLVLDEADRMFDMGFEPQVMKILRNIRPDRQTVLFSATFPRQMEALARKVLVKPVEIIVGARSVVAPEITQIVHVVSSLEAKFTKLLQLLGEFFHQSNGQESVLVFVERQDSADMLFRQLMDRGYPSLVIHGGKDQIDRDSAISDFKQGLSNLLIATSVAARGLDVKQLKLVINYDPPNHMEDYVHRVGRTGRAGATGTAVTLLLPEQEKNAVDIAKALKLSQVAVPPEVQAMVDSFEEKVKQGKEQFNGIKTGFGGNGLEKLDGARKEQRLLERQAYGEDNAQDKKNKDADDLDEDSGPTGAADSALGAEADNGGEQQPIISKVIAGSAPDNLGPDAGAFHAKLDVNDYPAKARWNVTSSSSLSKIIELHGVSVTLKGMYYPSGKNPGPEDEPKLYLLIEGSTENSVLEAYKDLQVRLVGGIEAAAASTKGRYTV